MTCLWRELKAFLSDRVQHVGVDDRQYIDNYNIIATTTNYFSRMTSPFLPYASSITTKIENLLKDGIAFLIGRIQDVGVDDRQYITDDVWLQVTLPAKLGGLSIANLKETHSAGAELAANNTQMFSTTRQL